MCGVMACWNPHVSEDQIQDAARLMNHRGIRSTYFEEDNLKVVHTRLPINGLDTYWDHPIQALTPFGEQFTWMVGEYYDFDKMACPNDTLAFSHIHGQDAGGCFTQLPGMYHALLYRKGTLYILQDMLGKKPIYYDPVMMAVASEIKALTALRGTAFFNVDYFNAIKDMKLPRKGDTPYEAIYQLSPNNIVMVDIPGGTFREREWFDWYRPEGEPLLTSLEDAVRKRLIADTPVGMLVSGGLDSSIIYTLAKKYTSKIQAFHISNSEEEYLELLSIPNLIKLDYHNGVDEPEMLYFAESPMDRGSLVPQYLLGQQASLPYVMISGDGADELFSGYRRAQLTDTQQFDLEELGKWHLPRLDKLMMAGTTELRCPFLDEDVYYTALATPWRDRVGKKQLKLIAEHIGVPERIIHRDKLPLKSPQQRQSKVEWQEKLIHVFTTYFAGGLHKYEHQRH